MATHPANSTVRVNRASLSGVSLAIYGNNNHVSGTSPRVYGNNNHVSGTNACVHGNNNTVSGKNCCVHGNNNHVFGMSAVVHGNNNKVSGMNCSVYGNENSVTGMNSTSNGVAAPSNSNGNTATVTFENGVRIISGGAFYENRGNTVHVVKRRVQRPIQVSLRGNDEETQDTDLACRVCMHNKKVVMSQCCGILLTCVACSKTLFEGKQVGEVSCMVCRAKVTNVQRVFY